MKLSLRLLLITLCPLLMVGCATRHAGPQPQTEVAIHRAPSAPAEQAPSGELESRIDPGIPQVEEPDAVAGQRDGSIRCVLKGTLGSDCRTRWRVVPSDSTTEARKLGTSRGSLRPRNDFEVKFWTSSKCGNKKWSAKNVRVISGSETVVKVWFKPSK